MSEKLPKFMYSSSQLRKVHQKNLTPNPFPESGRGVRIKASLKSRREVFQRGQSVPHPIEKGYILTSYLPITPSSYFLS
jgi:hypothetical protein